jgi:electron transfer flavoprotein beta subunit
MGMRFVACVKLTPDTEQLVDVQPQAVGTEDLGVTMVLNPWDEFAVEEILQLQERYDGEAAVLSMGTDDATEALKRAVAMGVEEAVLLSDDAFNGQRCMGDSTRSRPGSPEARRLHLVLTGKQSVDGNSGMVGPGLAAALGVPFVANVIKIEDVSDGTARSSACWTKASRPCA